ncbi:UPF0166 protein [Streptomyces sulfonofaciens]|uniref:UPF0166 protein n=1 Tax=Streptomyces sulfonofaciens TaxID=68272 RepID=A0A919GQ58_9ACTN|nr:DUF190 domain-containing protein [Streptomyces sulfonofaciens]GHH88774.1 UPF0166 protein [Streptomyces sulfonofaciens]
MARRPREPLGPPSARVADGRTRLRFVPACRLTITVASGSTWNHRPLYGEIVRRAKAYGLGSATVFRAVEGFGPDGVIATTRILSLADHLPLQIVALDEEERIRGFLGEVEPFMDAVESLVIDHVQRVVRR